MKLTLLWLTLLSPPSSPSHVDMAHSPWSRESNADTLLAWTVEDVPLLDLGRWDGPVSFSVIVSAVRLNDGTVFVADSRLNEIHKFGKDGTHHGSVGMTGDGPGEFRLIGNLFLSEDGTLGVFDRQHQRVSQFSVDNRFISDQSILGYSEPSSWVGQFSGGNYFARTRSPLLPTPVDGIMRDTVSYYSLDSDLSVNRLLARVPGPLSTQFIVSGQSGIRNALFSPFPRHAVSGPCLYLTQGDLPEVRIVHETGDLLAEVSLDLERQRVRDEDRRLWVESMLERTGIEPGSPESAYFSALGQQIQASEWLPYFSNIVVDELGYVWLQRYAPPSGPSAEWLVLKGTGELLGTVFFPRELYVFQISERTITGVFSDSTGEEVLQVLKLNREPHLDRSQAPAKCRLGVEMGG